MEFLNRVTLAPYEQARDRLETLFKEYPLVYGQKEEFKAKLWAKEEGIAEGASYEMFMAGVMRRLSADCAIEAEYPLNGKPVDLRVSHLGGDFYVECKTRLMSSAQLRSPNRHLDALLDALDSDRELAVSPYKGMVFARQMKGEAPSPAKFVNAVKEKLRGVAPLEDSNNGGAEGEISEPLVYKATPEDTVEVRFYWVGHKPLKGFVGINSAGGGVEKDETPLIVSALEEKARQHRNLDLPYVIAINWCNPTGSRTPARWEGGDPETEAIYGRGHFESVDDPNPHAVKFRVDPYARTLDYWLEQVFQEGLFLSRQGKPRNCHVSGVLFTRRTTPLLSRLSWKFFENPFAVLAAPELFRQIPNIRPHIRECSRSYTGSTTLHVQPNMLQYFPEEIRVGPNPISTTATFKHQGFLCSDMTDKAQLDDLLAVDYPESKEFRRLLEEAQSTQASEI